MNKATKAKLSAKADVIKALAHPTRLFIAEELVNGEKCVCELVKDIGADFSTVSKHLSIMKKVGLIEDRKQGLKVFYTLKAPCVLKFIGCIENVIKENAKEQLELLS